MPRTIRDIIGKDRELPVVDVTNSIRFATNYMYDNRVGAVVVLDGCEVIGVFSENDLLRRVVHEHLDPDTVNVREVMSNPFYWISLDERFEVAKAIMVDKGLKHLVVMDQHRRFQGFLSSRELLEADLSDARELVGKLNDDNCEHQFKNLRTQNKFVLNSHRNNVPHQMIAGTARRTKRRRTSVQLTTL